MSLSFRHCSCRWAATGGMAGWQQPLLSATARQTRSFRDGGRRRQEEKRAPEDPAAPASRKRSSGKALLVTAAAGAGLFALYSMAGGDLSTSSDPKTRGLNVDTFVPFTVVARDPVSPTSVVLTLRPAPGTSPLALAVTRAVLAETWARYSTWAVEAKQPQLQIARDYTPLPMVGRLDGRDGHGTDDDDDDCTVRLMIRVVPGGEMSRYLFQREVGDTVSLRGPRPGWDVVQRLGSRIGDGRVVFLAGGTGIAPALQAADAVLRAAVDQSGSGSNGSSSSSSNGSIGRTPLALPHVTILWANRQRQDGEGLPGASDKSGRKEAKSALTPNPIVRDLLDLQRRYGPDRLQVRCFVDEDRTFITEAAVVQATLGPSKGTGGGGFFSWRPWKSQPQQQAESSIQTTIPQKLSENSHCLYHSARQLEILEADIPPTTAAGSGPDSGSCSCDPSTPAGRHLLMISGPDGFVSLWAGPKRWAGGRERQGPLGGVLGTLRAKGSGVWDSWLVLKL